MILGKIAAPDLIVAAAELLEDAQGIDSGQSHDRQEPAKPNRECDARAKEHTIGRVCSETHRTISQPFTYPHAKRGAAPADAIYLCFC